MNERLKIFIFISLFFIIIGGMHLFVLERLYHYFALEKGLLFYAIIVLGAASYVLSTILESRFNNIITKDLYLASALWLGIIANAFFIALAVWLLTIIGIIPFNAAGLIMVIVTFISCAYGVINMMMIKISHIEFYSQKLDKDMRIVHLSDFHIGPIHKTRFLEKIVYQTNKLKPDIVIITGDLVDGRYKYRSDAFKALKDINAKTFFVMGNHDFYAGTAYVEALLRQYPIRILRNESIVYNGIQIIGLDDSEDKDRIGYELQHMHIMHEKFSILLYHRPDGFKHAVHKRIDLMLSGHTHAGQLFPFNIFTFLANGYLQGYYHEGSTHLYVSAGVGTWGPPMRTGSRSEIVEILIKNRH